MVAATIADDRREVSLQEAKDLLYKQEEELYDGLSKEEYRAIQRAREIAGRRRADDGTQIDNTSLDGAPGTIKLGGQTYLVGQPELADAAAIGAFIKTHAKKPLDELQQDAAFKYLPEDEQKTRLVDAARLQLDQQRQPWTAHSAMDAMLSLPGVRFTAWLLIRKHHPAFSYDDACSLITAENCVPVSLELDLASGMAKLGNSVGPPG